MTHTLIFGFFGQFHSLIYFHPLLFENINTECWTYQRWPYHTVSIVNPIYYKTKWWTVNRETVKCETDVENEAAYAEANAVSTGLHRPWFKPLLNIWYAQPCLFNFWIYNICSKVFISFFNIWYMRNNVDLIFDNMRFI